MSTKQKSPTFVSPEGEIKFSHLVKPNKKFKKVHGTYSVDLILDPNKPADQAFKTMLEAELAKAVPAIHAEKPKSKKYRIIDAVQPDTDKDGNPTGKWLVKFVSDAAWTDEKTGKVTEKTIRLFNDAKPKVQEITGKVNPGRESLVKVAFGILPYENASAEKIGLSLRLRQVQITKLVEFSGGCAFGEAEASAADSFGNDEESSSDSSGGASAADARDL
jgi:hypothetical protein